MLIGLPLEYFLYKIWYWYICTWLCPGCGRPVCHGAPPPSAAPVPVTSPPTPSLLTSDNCSCVASSLCRPGDQASYGQGQIDLRQTQFYNVTRLCYKSSSQECVRAWPGVLPPTAHHPHHAQASVLGASTVLKASTVLGEGEARHGHPANQANILLAKLKQNPGQ